MESTEIIKNAGLKITPQRKVVYEVMMELRHAAIDEIIKCVQSKDNQITREFNKQVQNYEMFL